MKANKAHTVKAVILSAGMGNRMSRLTQEVPKPLLEIGPLSLLSPKKTTFLERQISILKKIGVRSIGVVVGYNKEAVISKIKNLDVQIIENTTADISVSGTLHSFQFAVNSSFSALDGQHSTLLLDGDIVYQLDMMQDFIQNLDTSGLLVQPEINEDSEEVRVYGEGNNPYFIGKSLTRQLVNHHPCLGEAMGIVHFAPQDHALIIHAIDWLLSRGTAVEHEELSQRLMMLHRLRCYFPKKDSLFLEVDFQSEYNKLKDQLYQTILEKEKTIIWE